MPTRPPTLTHALHQAMASVLLIGLATQPITVRAAENSAPAELSPATGANAADDAAALLSRFPEGQLPASLPVMDALARLMQHGQADSVALLRSIAAVEQPRVAAAAMLALDAVRERVPAPTTPPARPGPVLACELPPPRAW